MLELRSPRRLLGGLSCALAVTLLCGVASARRAGIAASGCSGCHGSAAEAELSVTASPQTFAPGESIDVTVSIRGGDVGGIYVAQPGIGQLSTDDPNLKLAPEGLMHTTPKSAASGQVAFRFTWRAPSTPGSVHFEVAALAGNGDGRSSGDKPGAGIFSFVYGCTGQTYYRDQDGDGFGDDRLQPTFDCVGETPSGFSPNQDDCDDSNAKIFPSATETCNGKDDDCDDEIDEGAPSQELWPDEDGDGYYASQSGEPKVGCVPLQGYAAEPGDCAPRDPARNPGAEEVCNLVDDNCDSRTDERLRPQCGVGFCRRESPTCDPADCVAGTPTPETCNLLDDDCNGFVDDMATCPAGMQCVAGGCVPGSPNSGGAGGSGSGAAGLGGRAGVEGIGGSSSGGLAAGGRPTAPSGGSGTLPAGGTGTVAGSNSLPIAGAPGSSLTPSASSGCSSSASQRPKTGAGLWLLGASLLGLFYRLRRMK